MNFLQYLLLIIFKIHYLLPLTFPSSMKLLFLGFLNVSLSWPTSATVCHSFSVAFIEISQYPSPQLVYCLRFSPWYSIPLGFLSFHFTLSSSVILLILRKFNSYQNVNNSRIQTCSSESLPAPHVQHTQVSLGKYKCMFLLFQASQTQTGFIIILNSSCSVYLS